jgi:hypothetical protein
MIKKLNLPSRNQTHEVLLNGGKKQMLFPLIPELEFRKNLPSDTARHHQLQSYQVEGFHIPLHQPKQQYQNLQ